MRIKQLRIIVVVLFISVIGVNGVLGQSAIDLRINEILVENNNNYLDDFGEHSQIGRAHV